MSGVSGLARLLLSPCSCPLSLLAVPRHIRPAVGTVPLGEESRSARPPARLLSPVADGKPLGYIFCITPNPCWCAGSQALMEGAFIAALWYKSASPKPKSLQTQTDLQHREPRAPPRSRPLEQAALPCTTVRPQTETYVTGRRPGKIINFLESFFNGKERRKTPSDILISPWILLVPWCLSVMRPRRS